MSAEEIEVLKQEIAALKREAARKAVENEARDQLLEAWIGRLSTSCRDLLSLCKEKDVRIAALCRMVKEN